MSLTFKQEIAKIISQHNLTQLNPAESPAFHEDLTKLLKKLNTSRLALSMEFCKIDARGRLTVPLSYRILLGLEESTEMEIHLIKKDGAPDRLILRKSF